MLPPPPHSAAARRSGKTKNGTKNEIRKSNHGYNWSFPMEKAEVVDTLRSLYGTLLSLCCLFATGHYVVASPRHFTRKTQQINIWLSSLPSHQTVQSKIPSRRKSFARGCSAVYTFEAEASPLRAFMTNEVWRLEEAKRLRINKSLKEIENRTVMRLGKDWAITCNNNSNRIVSSCAQELSCKCHE